MSSSLAHVYPEVKPERITFIWSIKRFNLLPNDLGESRYSPWFYSGDNSEKWRLEFYQKAECIDSAGIIDDVSIYLVRDSPTKSRITISTEINIFESNNILKVASFTGIFGPKDTFEYTQSLEVCKLLPTNSDDDQLTINCIIDITTEVGTSLFDTQISNLNKSQLADDLRLLLEDPIFSDFMIIVGGKKFPIHKNILAKRSSVFAEIFHNDLKENHNKEVKIQNIKPDVMRGMLEFIYTDKVSNIKELASGLLKAAHEYDLRKLRIMCEKILYEDLNKENAAEILMLADRHRADTLKECVMKYIVDHAPEVVNSNNWKKTACYHKLLLELFNQLALSQEANDEKSQSSKA